MRPFTSPRSPDAAWGGYDVIVVGGGSAGSLIAGRLAAESDVEVLLLESGGWDLNPLSTSRASTPQVPGTPPLRG